jgi:hypothetical protein
MISLPQQMNQCAYQVREEMLSANFDMDSGNEEVLQQLQQSIAKLEEHLMEDVMSVPPPKPPAPAQRGQQRSNCDPGPSTNKTTHRCGPKDVSKAPKKPHKKCNSASAARAKQSKSPLPASATAATSTSSLSHSQTTPVNQARESQAPQDDEIEAKGDPVDTRAIHILALAVSAKTCTDTDLVIAGYPHKVLDRVTEEERSFAWLLVGVALSDPNVLPNQ